MSGIWNIYGIDHGLDGTDDADEAQKQPEPTILPKIALPQVNASDAMIPPDLSYANLYRAAKPLAQDAIRAQNTLHGKETPDETCKPALKEAGRQYQNTWSKIPDPYNDQSYTPLAQAAIGNPYNKVYEQYGDQLGHDLGFQPDAPTPLGKIFTDSVWEHTLKTGQRLHDNGITQAEMLYGLTGGDRTALDQAYKNRDILKDVIREQEQHNQASRNETGNPEEKQARRIMQGIHEIGGKGIAEALKIGLSKGASVPFEYSDSISTIFHKLNDAYGEKKIAESVVEGSKASLVYTNTYHVTNKALEPLWLLPKQAREYFASAAADQARNRYVQGVLEEQKQNYANKQSNQ